MKRLIGATLVILLWATVVGAQTFGAESGWTQGITVNMNLIGDSEGTWLVDQLGIVRVSEDRKTGLSPAVAGHLLWPVTSWLKMGPGLGAALGEDIIDGVGFNWVFGFVKGDELFTLGIGAWLNPNAVVLAPEFVIGQPAPVGPGGGSLPVRTVIKGVWTAQATVTLRLVNR